MTNYDLICILPLYGNDPKVVVGMISSLAKQKTKYNVYYKIYYDDTVIDSTILDMINNIFQSCNIIDYDCEYCENRHSGYKRNKGLEFALKNNIPYIWFIDQDDFLLLTSTFDAILTTITENDLPLLTISYSIPSNIQRYNREAIYRTPTMPWQYVFKTTELIGYYFDENLEYGSDLSVTIFYLLDHGYLEQVEPNKLNYVKERQILQDHIYFYNYLNADSVMGQRYVNNNSDANEMQYNQAVEILTKKWKKDNNAKKISKTFMFN